MSKARYMREYNRRPDRVRQQAHRNAKRRAERSGVVFSLKLEDIPELPSHCPALGIPLVAGDDTGRANAPSLDRLVAQFGYVPGNVVWISHLANCIKSSADVRQIYAVADWLHEEYRSRGYPCPTKGAPIPSDSKGGGRKKAGRDPDQ
jgi:hypothetical protein